MSEDDCTIEEYAQGLIELGQFLLDREALFVESYGVDLPEPLTINISTSSAEMLAQKISELGGGQKYSETSEYYSSTGVRRTFGPHLVNVYCQSSAVCTPKRKEMRRKDVVKLTDEAKEQIEAIKRAHTHSEEHEIVTEWECPPSLLSAKSNQDGG